MKPIINTCNTSRVIPKDVARAHFLKAVTKAKDSGANQYPDKFLAIMDAVQASKPSFDVNDVLAFSKPFNIPSGEILSLLEQWVNCYLALKKIEVISGCYDTDIIVTISI